MNAAMNALMWLLCDAPPVLVYAILGGVIGGSFAVLWRLRHW